MPFCKGTTESSESSKLLLITKKIIHLGLFIAFFSLSILALLDFLSYETTFRISREERNISLPSFTLCAYTNTNKGIFDKNQLANGAMGNGESLPLPITFRLLDQIEHTSPRSVDLNNYSSLEDYFNVTLKETWSFACKTDHKSKDACWPCITFNAPTLKTKRIFTEISIQMTNQTGTSLENVTHIIINIHEQDQSLKLQNTFDWGNSLFLTFKQGKRRNLKKSLTRFEKINIKEIAKCNPSEDYIPDKDIEEIVIRQVGCNLPWSHLKLDGLKTCTSEVDFDNYFAELEKSQEKIMTKSKKCKYIAWHALHYDDETFEGNNELEIELLGLRNEITIEKQVYAYTGSYFIGALGGYLGLFLGGSILGLFEFIETFVKLNFQVLSKSIHSMEQAFVNKFN